MEQTSLLPAPPARPPATLPELRDALDGAVAGPRTATTLLHVRTDRAANVALHRRVWDAVAAAVRAPR